jgi:formylglycine-generating enzyme required for sulfatase activity
MKKFFSFFIGLMFFGMSACVNESYENCPTVDEGGPKLVKFASGNVTHTYSTRTNLEGTSFLKDDSIGIYMLDDGATPIVPNYYDNRKFLAQSNGASNVPFDYVDADQAIYYQGSTLRFISYYPYRKAGSGAGEINNHIFPIDVTDQSDPAAIDLLYSRNATGHVLTDPVTTVKLDFGHVLSKIVIHVRKKGGTDIVIPGTTGVFNGSATTAGFKLEDSTLVNSGSATSIRMLGKVPDPNAIPSGANPATAYDTTFQAIIIPHAVSGDYIQLFSGGNRQFTWPIPTGSGGIQSFDAATIYTFWLTLEGEIVVEFTGSITPWIDSPYDQDNNVPQDVAGTKSTIVIGNGADVMDVAFIPKGKFTMGRTPGASTGTPHTVNITSGFLMGQTPVTYAQYAKFLNAIGATSGTADVSAFIPEAGSAPVAIFDDTKAFLTYNATGNPKWTATAGKELIPITFASYYGARAYAKWAGGEFADIPTEAQWEYAARATVPDGLYYIDYKSSDVSNYPGTGSAKLSEFAVYGQAAMANVGTKDPNGWNLYDMFGNNWEWVKDFTDGGDYTNTANPVDDPEQTTGTYHPVRSGTYSSTIGATSPLQINYRTLNAGNTNTNCTNGFRVIFKNIK